MRLNWCVFALAGLAVASGASAQNLPHHVREEAPVASAALTEGGASALLKRTSEEDVHGFKTVVIPYFQVQFIQASKASSQRGVASVSQAYRLSGVGPAEMQAITDKLYARFTGDLAAKGVTVRPLTEAQAASPGLQKVLAAAKPAPVTQGTVENTESSFFSPAGVPVYFQQNDPQFGAFTTVGSRAGWDEQQAAKELKAALVGVRLTINFVQQHSNANEHVLMFRGKTAKVESEAKLSIVPIATHAWVVTPNAKQPMGIPADRLRYELASPVVLEGGSIERVADATTAGQRRGDNFANAMSFLGGSGMNTDKHSAYEVRVHPVKYQTDAGGALDKLAGLMAARVAADL